jgi:prevent-host-death family protein
MMTTMPRRPTIGSRELKTRLGRYLRQVREGKTLVITDRGEPVAELKPLPRAGDQHGALQRLQTLGSVTRQEDRRLAPFRPVHPRGRSVSDAIVEDRDDRA